MQQTVPDFHPFVIRKFGMINQQLVAEQLGQPFRDLGGDGNLRQHIQNLASHLQHLIDQPHIDFRLSTGSNTVQETDFFLPENIMYFPVSLPLRLT